MAISKRNRNAWIKTLEGINIKEGNSPPGDGWMTFNELKEEHSLGDNKLRKLIKEGIVTKEIDFFEGTRPNTTGRLTRSIWYRPI